MLRNSDDFYDMDATVADMEDSDIEVQELLSGECDIDNLGDNKSDIGGDYNVDLYKQYSNDITMFGFNKVLSKEEEQEIAKKAAAGDKISANKLVEHNVLLVCNIARRYLGLGVEYMDLVQEGNMGLMRAIHKFDYTRGFRFTTYAYWWVKQSIIRYISEKGSVVKYPVHVTDMILTVRRTINSFVNAHGREPTSQEISTITGMSVSKVNYAKGLDKSYTSLDAIVSDEGDTSIVDFIASDALAFNPVIAFERNDLANGIKDVIKTYLSDREAYVINHRFGFGCDKMTLQEIADEFGVSRERVRQIEKCCIEKLRNPKARMRLIDFVV